MSQPLKSTHTHTHTHTPAPVTGSPQQGSQPRAGGQFNNLSRYPKLVNILCTLNLSWHRMAVFEDCQATMLTTQTSQLDTKQKCNYFKLLS